MLYIVDNILTYTIIYTHTYVINTDIFQIVIIYKNYEVIS